MKWMIPSNACIVRNGISSFSRWFHTDVARRTSQINVNRSCQLAFLGRRVLEATYATAPTPATKASEYADVAVNMEGDGDMVEDGWKVGGRQDTGRRDGGLSLTRSHARRVR